MTGVQTCALPISDVKAYKAIVIIILVVMGSPVVKEAFDRYLKKFREKRETLAGKEAA